MGFKPSGTVLCRVQLDETDWAIVRTVLRGEAGSARGPLRVPVREVARRTGGHPNTVARRLASLERGGVLDGVFFQPWPTPLGLVRGPCILEGTRVRGAASVAEALQAFPSVEIAIVGHGVALLHVWATTPEEHAKRLHALQDALRAREVIAGPTTADLPARPIDSEGISSLDVRIILALRRRRPRGLGAIAHGLGVTARTVERRIARMARLGGGTLLPRLRPGAVEGWVLVDLLAPRADPSAVAILASAFPDALLGPMGPCVFLAMRNLEEVERRRAQAARLPGLASLESYLVEDILFPDAFETWLASHVATSPLGDGSTQLPAGVSSARWIRTSKTATAWPKRG